MRPADDDPPTGEVPPLPHWTEPPTGAVPAIFADDTDAGRRGSTRGPRSPAAQPRFRAEGSDWAEADFADDLTRRARERSARSSNDGPGRRGSGVRARRSPSAAAGPPRADARTPAPRRRAGAARRSAPRPDADRRALGAGGRPRPPDRDHDRPRGRGRRAHLLHAAARTATAVLAAVDRRRRDARVLQRAAHAAACARRRSSRSSRRDALPLAAKHYGTDAYPVFFALIVVVLDAVVPVGGHAGPAAARRRDARCSCSRTSAGSAGSPGLMLASHRRRRPHPRRRALRRSPTTSFGFFVGSQFGRTPIAPKVSPQQDASRARSPAWSRRSSSAGRDRRPDRPVELTGQGLVLGVLVAVGAFLGDLCESMIKRDLGLKDFGTLLPGPRRRPRPLRRAAVLPADRLLPGRSPQDLC